VRASLLVFDGNKCLDSKSDKKDEKEKTLGHCIPIKDAKAALDSLGIGYILHSTHSHKPDFPRRRALILADMGGKEDLAACVNWVVQKIVEHVKENTDHGLVLVNAPKNCDMERTWLLPCLATPDADYEVFFSPDDAPALDVEGARAWWDERQAAEKKLDLALQQTERTHYASRADHDSNSTIARFNRENGGDWIEDLLMGAGYPLAWRKPEETRLNKPGGKKDPGVTIRTGSRGDWITYSHHKNGRLSGKVWDAVALFAEFKHGGDQRAALRR